MLASTWSFGCPVISRWIVGSRHLRSIIAPSMTGASRSHTSVAQAPLESTKHVRWASAGSDRTASNSARTKRHCCVASPPDTVTPLRNGAARRMSSSSSSTETWRGWWPSTAACPGIVCGLWHATQSKLQPCRNTTKRLPGPSTQLNVIVLATNPLGSPMRTTSLPRVTFVAPDPLHGPLREVVRLLAAGRQVIAGVADRFVLGDRGEIALAHEVAGDAHELVAVEVEREVTHSAGEGAADDVDHGRRVAHGGLVDVEDVADPGGEQPVVRGTRRDVLEHRGLVADRDAGAGGDGVVEVDSALAVEVAASSPAFAVGHRPGCDEFGEALGHPLRDCVGVPIVAVPDAGLVTFVGHQQVHALGEAEDAEHRGEPVEVDQPLGSQPVTLEEPLVLDQ